MSDHKCTVPSHVDSGLIIKYPPDVKRVKLPRKVIRDKREFDNTYHPGVENAELYHEVHRVRVSDRKPYPELRDWWEADRNSRVLCHNCGWMSSNQTSAPGYTSRLKVAYIRNNDALWDLGPNGPWILRDETNNSTNGWKTDYNTQQFIRPKKPSIPLVEMHRFGGPNDKFHFTIMARAKGCSLYSIWDNLTQEQMSDVLRDLREHMKQLRQITSTQMQRVDGSELRDAYIGNCTGLGCVKTGNNEEEWLENLTPAMRKSLLWSLWKRNKGLDADQTAKDSWIKEVDEKITQLKANFPRGGPYVLTHGDLHWENIFVSDDNPERKFRVSAIIDWEMAGFFPWWVEWFRAAGAEEARELLGEDAADTFYPGYTSEHFNEIKKVVQEVRKVWWEGGNHTESKHGLGAANRWYRKPFCACQPYTQEIRDSSLGWEQDHMDMFYIDSSDSEDDEPEDDRKFRKDERQFLRWFNKIQWPNQTNNGS